MFHVVTKAFLKWRLDLLVFTNVLLQKEQKIWRSVKQTIWGFWNNDEVCNPHPLIIIILNKMKFEQLFSFCLCKLQVRVEPLQSLSSVMKNDFLPPPPLQVGAQLLLTLTLLFYYVQNRVVWPCPLVLVSEGTEAIPGTNSHSCRESGYTRGAIAPLACPVSTDQCVGSCSRFRFLSL